MKISFVIPAYNEENYVGKCLTSVLKQLGRGHYDAEVIVVNNASTDNTKSVAQSFKGVKVVDEPKKGLIAARSAGFAAATGDLIANLDADVIMQPGWIDTVLDIFAKHPKIVAVSGPVIYYDTSPFTQFFSKLFYLAGAVSNLLGGSILQGGNYVIKKTALQAIGGYNQNIHFFGEDADVAKRVSKIGKVKFTMRLPMHASGRRIKAEGLLLTGLIGALDHLWILFFGHPFKKTAEKDIRF